MIKILLIPALFALTLARPPAFKDCNASQYEFFSHYSLGQQRQLNRTFDLLNTQLPPLPALTYNSSDLLYRYAILNTTAASLYRSSHQTAEVIGDDTIYIKGGRVETTLTFTWSKNSQQGKASADCLSDPISFAKLVYQSEGFIKFKVGDYTNITYYTTACNITRVDPSLQPKDIQILQFMLNTATDLTVKQQLEDTTAKFYPNALNQSLYEDRQPISNSSQYAWKDPTAAKKDLVINYTLLPVGAHLQTAGLSLTFVTEITDDDQWKCGAAVPHAPKDIEKYGGVQEYLSLSVLENSVRWAVERGYLDTDLTRDNWQSKVFQFYAGDLYSLIPLLATKYYASQPVTGQCKAQLANLKLSKTLNSNLLLSVHYLCSLSINSTLVSQFEVDPNFIVEIRPQQTYLDFHVVKMNRFAHFKDVGEYQIRDLELASLFLTRCLERVMEGRVIGSGWPIYARDEPLVGLEDGLLFVYERTQAKVDNKL